VWLVAKPILWTVWLAKRTFSVVLYMSLNHTAFHVASYASASNIVMMPKPRCCLTHLCSCVDCTQLTHSLRMMYFADEQHNCPKKKVSTSQTHGGFKCIKQPCKNGHDHLVFYLHGISKKAFTFLKQFQWSSNPDQKLSFAVITAHICAHT
jgi:hypothetical protein